MLGIAQAQTTKQLACQWNSYGYCAHYVQQVRISQMSRSEGHKIVALTPLDGTALVAHVLFCHLRDLHATGEMAHSTAAPWHRIVACGLIHW